jgi:hypothetical protein
MSQIAQLASGQITAVDVLTIELVETDETPAVVIVRSDRRQMPGAPYKRGVAGVWIGGCTSDGSRRTLPRRNRTHAAISNKPTTKAAVPSRPPSTV